MHIIDNNYFVCTLGQAASVNEKDPHDFSTIAEFLEKQQKSWPSEPAVGFPIPSKNMTEGSWEYELLTFHDLYHGSLAFAGLLQDTLSEESQHVDSSPERTIALLCPSSPVFLFTWLGLMKLGYAVLLIAPQCQPSAIAHLCKTCNVQYLLCDDIYSQLAKDTVDLAESTLQSLVLPFTLNENHVFDYIRNGNGHAINVDPIWTVSEHDVAYLHHTSGTSTGLPKPIAQTHRAAVGVLPCLKGKGSATFTTTPLYHGGIADCFRAWTSDALIWLFPGKEVPITASNVLKSLESARQATVQLEAPPVKYFSSVPYVLQMLAVQPEGLACLRHVDIVGVGGAALPQTIGDDLVEKGVNLVSRFGSAECGFLMSSHRDYSKDKEWQYLRSGNGSEALRFESRDADLAELVVLSGWPHMAKCNRGDGSYATSDLFIHHPAIRDAWKYHSRADSQLTLITGKKFDPEPLEAAIAASSLLSDVFIFGNGKQYPGALLFRSKDSSDLSSTSFIEKIWPQIEKINAESQGHTRLSKSMLVVMPDNAPRLEKSSKGTVLRVQAEKKYKEHIEKVYGKADDLHELFKGIVPENKILEFLLETIKSVANITSSIPETADLFAQGVDSVACMQIRAVIQKRVMPGGPTLPLNVIYDCGSIERLSKFLLNLREGKKIESEDETLLMRQLVEELGSFPTGSENTSPSESIYGYEDKVYKGEVVLLTGATGALGAHILDQLRSDFSVSEVICLVRATHSYAAQNRVTKSLIQRRKAPLRPGNLKVGCLVAKIGEPRLGLSDDEYDRLARKVTIIIHAAWAVNFSMRLRSFVKDHIVGLRNLIDLALRSPYDIPPRFVFCSSTASVLGPAAQATIKEAVSHDPHTSSSLGYSRSKWVAEAICEQAYLHSKLNGRLSVVRIGQLCGDTQSGVWNVTEAWPLMLSTVKLTGSLPALEEEKLAWLPVDIAGRAISQIAFDQEESTNDSLPVYHIINEDRTATWMDLLNWIKKLNRDSFRIIPARQWVEQLDSVKGEAMKHPARKLLGLWKNAYCANERNSQDKHRDITFAMEGTKEIAPVMKSVQPINEEQFRKIWAWMQEEMLDGKVNLDAEKASMYQY